MVSVGGISVQSTQWASGSGSLVSDEECPLRVYEPYREEQDRLMDRPNGSDSELERRVQLVLAIGHEIANHLGAIRLEAHLLDEELGARALAEASVSIDGLAGRGTPLLALLRPILVATPPVGDGRDRWSDVLDRIGREVEDEGTRAVRFELERSAEAATPAAPGVDWLHPLVMALVQATLAHVHPKGVIRLALEIDAGLREIVLLLEDDGAEEDCSATAPLRGRPLVLAIARLLLGELGGRVETSREQRTRLRLVFPSEPAR